MPSFKASKDRLTPLLELMQLVIYFMLKSMLTYHSPNPKALNNYVKSTLPVFYQWNNKAWMTPYLFIT